MSLFCQKMMKEREKNDGCPQFCVQIEDIIVGSGSRLEQPTLGKSSLNEALRIDQAVVKADIAIVRLVMGCRPTARGLKDYKLHIGGGLLMQW